MVHFDDSLVKFISEIKTFFNLEVLEDVIFIRDITGQLGACVNWELSEEAKTTLECAIRKALGPYARPFSLVTDKKDFDADFILGEAKNLPYISVASNAVRLIDRRAVGTDWLSAPVFNRPDSLKSYTFASIKGGVGRSTALCVAAAHLSRRGRRVLAIDFDLEAPGIGSMLLKEDQLPLFGSLDFLVECQVGGFDESIIKDIAGSSFLGSAGARVDVVPAVGKMTLKYPENALGKIARAYLEMPGETTRITIGGKLRKLVEFFEATGLYDVILVDARAGLHETTAAAMFALGGDVLLFGTDQPQTFQGYSLLFAHLRQFKVDPSEDWREKISFVHAKSGRTEKVKLEAEERFKDVYSLLSFATSSNEGEIFTKDDIDAVWDDSVKVPLDELVEPKTIHILDDSQYRDFDPLKSEDLLNIDVYQHTFGDLIEFFNEELESSVREL